MPRLSEIEHFHLNSFKIARPDWPVAVMETRYTDERPDAGPHVYPPSHPYLSGMAYVLQQLKTARGLVLDIGSPYPQNLAVNAIRDLALTVLDCRDHPDAKRDGVGFVKGSATHIPFVSESFDIVTSMWVMGHVGDGRYGDEFYTNGDLIMLNEIARVLKPGGKAIIGPGLVDDKPAMIFNMHRIYSWPWLEEQFTECGFDVTDRRNLPVRAEMFMDPTWNPGDEILFHRQEGHYGVATLLKR